MCFYEFKPSALFKVIEKEECIFEVECGTKYSGRHHIVWSIEFFKTSGPYKKC
jgi:hypothetical protein